jgi:hypothetical protein
VKSKQPAYMAGRSGKSGNKATVHSPAGRFHDDARFDNGFSCTLPCGAAATRALCWRSWRSVGDSSGKMFRKAERSATATTCAIAFRGNSSK